MPAKYLATRIPAAIGFTVKVWVQLVENGGQEEEYVNVTVATPPHTDGAPVLSFVRTPLQPPLALAAASQFAKATFICACVCKTGETYGAGQFKLTTGAGVTENEAVQVCVAPQSLVTVKVTVVLPPQASGAPVLLFETTALQPPEAVVVVSQFANFALMLTCV